MNIESATRRNSSGELDDEIGTSHKLIEEEEQQQQKPKKNGLVKKLSQNGQTGNGNAVVITKESLTLMPDDVTLTNGVATKEEIQAVQQEEIVTNQHDNNNEVREIC
jgi:hypothetical protein